MKLPVQELPVYKTSLPFSKKEIEYRPYTVKEEKILMMAMTTDAAEDAVTAVRQLIKNCTGLDANAMAPVDIEWIFLKLRSASVSNVIDVIIYPQCGQDEESECATEVKTFVNIDKVEIKNMDLIKDNFTFNNQGWIIKLTEDIGIIINPIDNVNELDNEKYLWTCLHSIVSKKEVIYKEDMAEEEFINWIDGFTKKDKSNIEKFFGDTPYTYYKIEHVCSTCQAKYVIELKEIMSFLD